MMCDVRTVSDYKTENIWFFSFYRLDKSQGLFVIKTDIHRNQADISFQQQRYRFEIVTEQYHLLERIYGLANILMYES